MAKIAVGPAGREIVNIEIGGNRETAPRNAPNNTPVTTPPPEVLDGAEPELAAQTQRGQVEAGGPKTTTPQNDGGDVLWAGHDFPETQPTKPGNIPAPPTQTDTPAPTTTTPTHGDWPILTFPFPNRNTGFDPHNRDEHRRRDDNRERDHRGRSDTNHAHLRRGVIRDYLRQNLQTTVLDSGDWTNSPIEIQRLTQTVAASLARAFDDPTLASGRNLTYITQEISHLLTREFASLTSQPQVVPFHIAREIATLLLPRLAAEAPARFAQMTDRQLLDGLILLQLCCDPGRNMKDMREITGHRPSILPDGIRWSMFRDTGLLAANLMREGVALRNTAQIDAAVQRFLKMLLVNNELGILLAAVRLAADARMGRLPVGSIATLVRIYELIAQLMIATDRAMKQAADASSRKPAELKTTDRGLAFASALEPAESESALRQYLAFNPAAHADSGASAFFAEQLAETSARIAVDSSQREIVEWLSSGRHRFVTEVDLGKPVGIVIDKATDECFTASQIRIVLVRDGSVLGWHILRSSLVR